MPVLMKSENISPRMPASKVRTTEMTMAVFWSPIVITASLRTCASISVRITSIRWLRSSRSVSVRARLARASVKFPASSSDNSRLYSFTEVAMEIAGHALDSIVDPAEPGVVGSRRGVVDDRIDQGARRLRFLIYFLPLRLIDFSLIRKRMTRRAATASCRSSSGAAPEPVPANGYSSAPDARTLRHICC